MPTDFRTNPALKLLEQLSDENLDFFKQFDGSLDEALTTLR